MFRSHKRAPLVAALTLALGASACSTIADSSLDEGEGEGNTGDGDGDGDGSGPEHGGSGPAETAGDETGDGDPEEELPAAVEDPCFAASMCDPDQAQLVAHDLREAQLEAAPELVRARVLDGDGLVPPIPLSVQSFFNHFDHDHAPASGWAPELSTTLWASPMVNIEAPPRYHLEYALRGPAMAAEQRLSVDLAVVVDLGPFMSGEALDLVHEALAALDAALAPGDRVTLIGAGESPITLGTVVVEGAGLASLTGLVEQQALEPSPGPAAIAGALALAYEAIADAEEGQRQGRVLLLSNGYFDAAAIEPLVDDEADAGRYLVTVGVGDPALFDDASVRALAVEGRGAMLFASDAEQLWTELEQDFVANFLAAATELELSMTLPAGLALRQRGEADATQQHGEAKLAMLAPNEALVFHHELEACGELAADAVIRVELEWTDPLAQTAMQAVWEQPVAALVEPSAQQQKGAAIVAYVRALRSFRDGRAMTLDYGVVLDAISLVSGALEGSPDDADLVEMSSVLARLF